MTGNISQSGQKTFLTNSMFGIEISYQGSLLQGEFFLHPYIDETNKTIKYFCFESLEAKILFEKMLKISGVGPKTAFSISAIPPMTLHNAVEDFDTSVLEAVQGIGKKSAKKIMVELKDSLSKGDLTKLNNNDQITSNIIKTLANMGYVKQDIEKHIRTYQGSIKKENIQEVIVRLINQLKQ